MNPFYIGLPLWALCTFSAYCLRERALGSLSAEQIGGIVLVQRPDRIRLLTILIAILALFLALRFGIPTLQNLWFLLVLGAITTVCTTVEVRACKSIWAGLPQAPARTFIASRVVGLVGFLSLVGAMAATVL